MASAGAGAGASAALPLPRRPLSPVERAELKAALTDFSKERTEALQAVSTMALLGGVSGFAVGRSAGASRLPPRRRRRLPSPPVPAPRPL
jgi:hypothetical protein